MFPARCCTIGNKARVIDARNPRSVLVKLLDDYGQCSGFREDDLEPYVTQL
jgi:hypothetical protein